MRWAGAGARDPDTAAAVLAWFARRRNASDHLGRTMRERFGVRLLKAADGPFDADWRG